MEKIIIFCAFLIIAVICSGCTNPSVENINDFQMQSNNAIENNPSISTTPTESDYDRNVRIVKELVVEYHNSHTYSMTDFYVCSDMASDVWDMLKTKGIPAKIWIGNIEKDITKIEDATHAWVLAEVSPGNWIALETTGGYLVCNDPNICSSNNSRYFFGWSYDNPREFKEALDKRKHPCPEGSIYGSDNLCHPACGIKTYCTDNTICVNGQCIGCDSGYILGNDLKCHQPCGSTTTYCTGNTVCVNGKCMGCDSGYILGNDLKCHQPCGSTTTYCPGNSICVNGKCMG